MVHSHRWTILLVAASLAFPAAAASWMAFGTSEPDNAKDSTSFLWFDPPPVGSSRVYFNAVPEEYPIGNVNVGQLGSRITPSPELTYHAVLGQWADCNGDGYIGFAETAMLEYPAALLDATQLAVCPDGTAHNAAGWVTELNWIGTSAKISGVANSDRDPRIIVDDGAVVWGDEGLPDTKIAGGSFCFVNPPYGSFQSTGGFLDYADCFDGYRLRRSLTDAMLGSTQTVAGQPLTTPGLDPSNANGLAIRSWRDASPLNIPTFGNDDSSRSAATLQDCQAQPLLAPEYAIIRPLFDSEPAPVASNPSLHAQWQAERDTFASPGFPRPVAPGNVNPPQPGASPPGAWGGGNLPGTVNETNAETRGGASNCDHSKDPSDGAFYRDLQETDVHTSAGLAKTQPDHNFNFSTQNRGHSLAQDSVTTLVDPAHPGCFGLDRVCHNAFTETDWSTRVITINNAPALVRTDIAAGTAEGAGPHYVTFYAHVSSASGTTPIGRDRYGAQLCSTIGAGQQSSGGWECDPSHWFTLADGSPDPVQYTFPHAKVGQPYELRDIDCDDGQIVAGIPVYAGDGGISATTCDTP